MKKRKRDRKDRAEIELKADPEKDSLKLDRCMEQFNDRSFYLVIPYNNLRRK